MFQASDAVVIEPRDAATASILWLHGLGADGHDFEPIVPELGANATRGLRFVFPHAPYRPVTINNGYVMRAWYDVLDMELTRRSDEAGIRSSADLLRRYIAAETEKGMPSERIVLAGFSQGGAIALHTGLRHEQRLAGILALSTYLPLPEVVAREAHETNADVPIFMAHGTADPVVGIAHAERSRDLLAARGYRVEWHSYPMMHAVCAEEIRDIARWLSEVLG
ncbi:MAG: alpha/beta fold hydrolase [Gammaproteobacteria bacterium]|nr:alpha/beta fold hydrolase [Gammaproteobacteria bacterium]NIR83315.1 alpha/beta fold hydrolase [Gammaproteobacteria bacterium]NIR91115.1 alpha/beta fold hydrolase [Gammaproteobacteria bacterium]NIU04482.1 alpha/beta fold hydrolase [Gammaproteobacteria bacterium]NIW87118.1 alpha/beta fold hydrolase [Gammaproteobacteria bacterium]